MWVFASPGTLHQSPGEAEQCAQSPCDGVARSLRTPVRFHWMQAHIEHFSPFSLMLAANMDTVAVVRDFALIPGRTTTRHIAAAIGFCLVESEVTDPAQ